ncbi:MAG: amidohydrolase family protein, partial [Nitrososphaerales archaeon]
MLIKNVSMLYGRDLYYVTNANIAVEDGIFKKPSSEDTHFEEVYDGEGLLMIPGLINAHTHITDSIAKDVAADQDLDKRVHPIYGIKRSVIKETPREYLSAYMQASALSMLKNGITTFANFTEGGLDGIALLEEAVGSMDIRCVTLGRVEYYFDLESAQRNDELPHDAMRAAELVIRACDGFGISGANEYSDKALTYFRRTANAYDKLLAVHAAETEYTNDRSLKNFGRSEVSRIIEHLSPDLVVHMTNASDADIQMTADKGIGIVVCPRANGVLGAGIPKVTNMVRHGCKVAIGTDNVMLNAPDLFREMDYLWKVSRAMENNFLSAKEIVKMTTVNAADILKLGRLGFIDENMLADAVFIDAHHVDVDPIHDPYAAIVHRANGNSIRAVMIGGKFVHG